jgi:trans-aconitate methyltransferase
MKNPGNTEINAQAYTSNSEIQLSLADQLLENYSFREDSRVLDIGCGDGRITSNIAKKVPKGSAIGIDASANMIGYAKSHYPSDKFSNLQFFCRKAEELSLQQKFDHIVSFNCFHWVRPWKKTLTLFYNLLNPGGEVLMLTYPKDSLYYLPFHETSEHFPEYLDRAACATMFTALELESALRELGMILETFESYNSTISYEDSTAMKDFTRIWLTSYIPLPEDQQEKFLDILVEKTIPYRIDKGDGKIHLPYTALFVKAIK